MLASLCNFEASKCGVFPLLGLPLLGILRLDSGEVWPWWNFSMTNRGLDREQLTAFSHRLTSLDSGHPRGPSWCGWVESTDSPPTVAWCPSSGCCRFAQLTLQDAKSGCWRDGKATCLGCCASDNGGFATVVFSVWVRQGELELASLLIVSLPSLKNVAVWIWDFLVWLRTSCARISNKKIWVWVNTYRYIFSGMNIHLPAILGFTRYQGFDPSPYLLSFQVKSQNISSDLHDSSILSTPSQERTYPYPRRSHGQWRRQAQVWGEGHGPFINASRVHRKTLELCQ